MRVVLFTGKGGVGKTTVAAATAVRAARGRPADPGDVAPTPRTRWPTRSRWRSARRRPQLAENLWAQQIDAQDRLEDNWREIQDYMIQFMNWAGVETIQAEELTVIPGLDEIFALIDVKHARGERASTTC